MLEPTESPSGVIPLSSRLSKSASDQSFSRAWVMLGTQPLPFRIRSARKALAGLDAADKIARRVTFDAMAGPIHEIGAAVPLLGLGRVRLEGFIVEK